MHTPGFADKTPPPLPPQKSFKKRRAHQCKERDFFLLWPQWLWEAQEPKGQLVRITVFMWPTWNGCSRSTAHCPGHTHVRDRQDQTGRDWKYPYCLEVVGTVERGTTGFHLGSLFWGLWYFPILSTFPSVCLMNFQAFSLIFFYFHDCTSDTAIACRCWPQLWLQPSNCLAHQTTELPPVALRPCHSRLHSLSFNPQPGLSVYARLPFPSFPLGVISSFQPPCFS